MKKKLKALIGMMSLCAVGTVGSALALTRNSATANGTAGSFDKAIYLYWGTDTSTASLEDCDDLVVNEAQYRYLSVSPKSTKSVAGNVNIKFTLAASDGDYFIDGVSVTVYKTESLCTDSTVAAAINGATAELTLDKDNLEDTAVLAVSANTTAHETKAYYAIVIEYDGSNVSGKTLGGSVTIAQTFSAAA